VLGEIGESHTSAANQTDEETPTWAGSADAQAATGFTLTTLIRWAKAKKIRSQRTAGGEWLFHIEDCLRHANGETEEANELTPAGVNAQLVQALKASQKHVEMLVEPARKFLEAVSDENGKLRGRVAELEEKLSKQVDKWEASLSLEHERRMEEQREARAWQRQERIVKEMIDFLPAVAMGVAGHFGQTQAQEAILVRMVSNFSGEQIEKLVASGALGPTELAILERLRATHQKGTNGQAKAAAPDGRAA
jgi:ATP-dependent Lon protease